MTSTRAVLVVAFGALALGSCGERDPSPPPAAQEHSQVADSPAGYAPVELDAERVQLFGIRTEPVRNEPLTREVRTVGVVRTDETRESHVHVKWEGWIQEFFVSYVGQEVKRGDPLFSVYSPDLVTAQQELIVARARADSTTASGRAGERASSEALLETARTKLRFFDVDDAAIARIEKEGHVLRTLIVRAPRSGTVIEKQVLPGMYVEPPMDLYTIADLSRVWVLADLYEYEAPFVHVGQASRFSPVGVEGSPLDIAGSVAFVDPTVDTDTRTVKVRLELPNVERRLRPGAYGTVRLEIPLESALSVPADSVLDTGTRRLVFVRVGAGRFDPREVRLGARAGSRVQVFSGVLEGEEVVTRAQFLLDSESRLRGASAGTEGVHGAHP